MSAGTPGSVQTVIEPVAIDRRVLDHCWEVVLAHNGTLYLRLLVPMQEAGTDQEAIRWALHRYEASKR